MTNFLWGFVLCSLGWSWTCHLLASVSWVPWVLQFLTFLTPWGSFQEAGSGTDKSMWTSLKRTLYEWVLWMLELEHKWFYLYLKTRCPVGWEEPLSCAYESFYSFLSLILGLVSPTLLCIPYITENDCKIFMGIFKTTQEDFWSIVKSHTWNAQQAEYFSFHNDVVNQFFLSPDKSFFFKLCTYVTKSCFLRYPKGCEQPRGVYKVAQCRIVNICVLCPHLIHFSGLVLPGPSFPSWTTLPDWCPPEVSWS